MICPYLLNRAHFGDALDLARLLPDESVNCIVTSPAYWGLRDYGVDGQWGMEATPKEYVDHLVALFRELRRALRADGTFWLNLGDCYCTRANGPVGESHLEGSKTPHAQYRRANSRRSRASFRRDRHVTGDISHRAAPGLKHKDLVGIPWMTAFALRADGWYLRSDIIWHKPNPMPESVTDRPTKAHEYLFLLTKSERYWYDAEAIKEPSITRDKRKPYAPGQIDERGNGHDRGGGQLRSTDPTLRNKRSVWTVATQPYSGAHFATFPPKLVEPCILAGCPKDGVVLDPFLGSGTTGQVAQRLGRRWIGFDIDPKNRELIAKRTAQQGLFGDDRESASL